MDEPNKADDDFSLTKLYEWIRGLEHRAIRRAAAQFPEGEGGTIKFGRRYLPWSDKTNSNE